MSDQVKAIQAIIDEHETVKDQMRQAVRSIEGWQIGLESAVASEEMAELESLVAKQWSIVQAVGFLEQGMLSHFQREERELSEFTGPVIAEAIKAKHAEILLQLQTVRLLLTETDLKSMSIAELAGKYPNVKRDLENTYRMIAEHGLSEDVTLRLVLKGILRRAERRHPSSSTPSG